MSAALIMDLYLQSKANSPTSVSDWLKITMRIISGDESWGFFDIHRFVHWEFVTHDQHLSMQLYWYLMEEICCKSPQQWCVLLYKTVLYHKILFKLKDQSFNTVEEIQHVADQHSSWSKNKQQSWKRSFHSRGHNGDSSEFYKRWEFAFYD